MEKMEKRSKNMKKLLVLALIICMMAVSAVAFAEELDYNFTIGFSSLRSEERR